MFVRNEHAGIMGVIPGDPGYSPFWSIWMVEVTELYQGELITSVAALSEAQKRGLVKTPIPMPLAINCPVVLNTVKVEVGGGVEPQGPNKTCYYEGFEVDYYIFRVGMGMIASPLLADGVHMPLGEVYSLRREGGEPLSEYERQVDMTGDNDTKDTNNILKLDFSAQPYSPLVEVVSVTVPADYKSIDTNVSQLAADYTSVDDMFSPDGSPISGNIISFSGTDVWRNMPIQFASGEL